MRWGRDSKGTRWDRQKRPKVAASLSTHKRVAGEHWSERHQRRLDAAMQSLGELGKAAETLGLRVTLLEPGVNGAGDRIRFDLAETANQRGRALAIWHPADADLVAWRPARETWHLHGWREVLGKVAWLACDAREARLKVQGGMRTGT